MRTFKEKCHCSPSSVEEWCELLNFAREQGVPIEHYSHHLSYIRCKNIHWGVEIQTTFRAFGKKITVEQFKEYCINWETVEALKML